MHDELILHVHMNEKEEVEKAVRTCMTADFDFRLLFLYLSNLVLTGESSLMIIELLA